MEDIEEIEKMSGSKWAKIGARFIFAIILLNSVIIYLQVSGYDYKWLEMLDITCTLIFIIEMVLKIRANGFRNYWKDGWNKLDGTLVILSLPSLITFFVPMAGANLSVLLALRLLRTLRFFRFIHFFGGGVTQIAAGFKRAMIASSSVLAAFFIIIVIFGLINCSLFQDVAPQFFSTPLEAIYSVFRLFTVEGWYDIPDAVAQGTATPTMAGVIRFYFCVLLIAGGIIGMSFINSVFVDAMAEDNNEEINEKLKDLEEKLDKVLKALDEKKD